METKLTQLSVSDTRKPMGKPPLDKDSKTKPTQIRMTAETRARISSLVGDYGMAKFIREAINNELERRENEKPD
jgi:hypothetical protein